jgi:hypothetical protein
MQIPPVNSAALISSLDRERTPPDSRILHRRKKNYAKLSVAYD